MPPTFVRVEQLLAYRLVDKNVMGSCLLEYRFAAHHNGAAATDNVSEVWVSTVALSADQKTAVRKHHASNDNLFVNAPSTVLGKRHGIDESSNDTFEVPYSWDDKCVVREDCVLDDKVWAFREDSTMPYRGVIEDVNPIDVQAVSVYWDDGAKFQRLVRVNRVFPRIFTEHTAMSLAAQASRNAAQATLQAAQATRDAAEATRQAATATRDAADATRQAAQATRDAVNDVQAIAQTVCEAALATQDKIHTWLSNIQPPLPEP